MLKIKIRGSSKSLRFILLHPRVSAQHFTATHLPPSGRHRSTSALGYFWYVTSYLSQNLFLHYWLSLCAGVHMCDNNLTTRVPELLTSHWKTHFNSNRNWCQSLLVNFGTSEATPDLRTAFVQAVKHQLSSWSGLLAAQLTSSFWWYTAPIWSECNFNRTHRQR